MTRVTRREILRTGAASLLGLSCGRVWLAPQARAEGTLAAHDARTIGAPLLVGVFLRGAADGLHLVPPIGDPDYARLRGSLALDETLPFAPGFGLHPAFAPLGDVIERRQLAVVHACGSTAGTRSHFEAQDRIEAGDPEGRDLSSGWLARALGPADGLLERVTVGSDAPLTLRGGEALALDASGNVGLLRAPDRVRDALRDLWASGGDDPVRVAGRRGLDALDELERALGSRGARSKRRRGGRRGLAGSVETLLELERSRVPVRAVMLESDGWDTHAAQGAEKGAMASRIEDLARSLARLDAGLRGRRDLCVFVMTEFGRTVRPNGSGGSDHGTAGALLVLGPRVRGGVYGDWPGLSEGALYEGRDLALATDYRSVLSEIVRAHRGSVPESTFPGFRPQTLGLIA